ncbi:MAG: hypothetical protein AB7O84_24810, partial [Planctomycetota bacterium]
MPFRWLPALPARQAMTGVLFASVSVFASVFAFAPHPATAQGAAPGSRTETRWSPPRTADGKPDLQGIFTFSTITPLQRPTGLAEKD